MTPEELKEFEDSYDEWKKSLSTDKSSKSEKKDKRQRAKKEMLKVEKLAEILEKHEIDYRYNEDLNLPEVKIEGKWIDISNQKRDAIYKMLQVEPEIAATTERDYSITVNALLDRRRCRPLRDYLVECHEEFLLYVRRYPNAREYIHDFLLKYVEFEEPKYIVESIWKYWLANAVGKVITGGQNICLVIESEKQGTGKSTLAAALCKDFDMMFKRGAINASSEDHLLCQASTFIWEVDELDGTTKRQVEDLKSFLTASVTRIRKKYEVNPTTMRSICSFIATTNESKYLHDSENRRFFHLKIKPNTQENINILNRFNECVPDSDVDVPPVQLLWGYAYALWKQSSNEGKNIIFMKPELQEYQHFSNIEHTAYDSTIDLLNNHFTITGRLSSFTPETIIFKVLNIKTGNDTVKYLRRYLKHKECERIRKKHGGKLVYGYKGIIPTDDKTFEFDPAIIIDKYLEITHNDDDVVYYNDIAQLFIDRKFKVNKSQQMAISKYLIADLGLTKKQETTGDRRYLYIGCRLKK